MQSTRTADPTAALLFRQRFLEGKAEADPDEKVEDLSKLPLSHAAEKYFEWKAANNSSETIARERRMFKNVLKFFGQEKPVRSIDLQMMRRYQIERRKQISPTMKQPVGPRAVNYELLLLKGVKVYTGCWTAQLAEGYKRLREPESREGKVATPDQLRTMVIQAMANEHWQLAMWCAAVAAGTGCRGGEIRKLRLNDIRLANDTIRVVREISKNRKERNPRLMALADGGLRQLLERAQALGATQPNHCLLPLNIKKSGHLANHTDEKWDVNRPMTSWVKSWRKLMEACGMKGFRFHDLRHTFRTQGAEAGVPLEVMMAQLGHMDRQTSIKYVHVQQRALERAKELIELQQAEVLAAAIGGNGRE